MGLRSTVAGRVGRGNWGRTRTAYAALCHGPMLQNSTPSLPENCFCGTRPCPPRKGARGLGGFEGGHPPVYKPGVHSSRRADMWTGGPLIGFWWGRGGGWWEGVVCPWKYLFNTCTRRGKY